MAKRGRPRKSDGGKPPKRKVVKIKLAERMNAGKVIAPYEIMERIIAVERADLKPARIGIAWQDGIRADADGRLSLGKCCKRSDLDRSLDGYDFIVVLNREAWIGLKEPNRERLMYHELEHAQIVTDVDGQPKFNDQNRPVCRIRKHNIEDFRSVVKKYGWQDDLSDLAKAGIEDAQRPLLQGLEDGTTKSTNDVKRGRTCRVCGMNDETCEGCEGQRQCGPAACDWAEPDLCKPCAGKSPAATKPESFAEDAPTGGAEETAERIEIKCKGMKQARLNAMVISKDGLWWLEYQVQMGNYAQGKAIMESYPNRRACLADLKHRVVDMWLDELEITGTADHQRGIQARRGQMREEIDAELDKLIDAAGTV